MSEEKCFCHLNGYKVKDADARNEINTVKNDILGFKEETKNSFDEANRNISLLSNRKFIFIGDSYGQGYSPDGNVQSWISKIITNLGLASENCFSTAKGGTCFGNVGNNFLTLLQEIGGTVPNKNEITDIVVCGGYNDISFAMDDINSGIDSFLTYSKANYPNAVVRFGNIGWTTDCTKFTLLNKVTACYQRHISSKSVYMNGVENILHHTSYMASDGYHPNGSGQTELAIGIANAIITGNCSITRAYTGADITPASGWTVGNAKAFGTMQSNDILEFIADNNQFNHEAFTMTMNGTMYELGTFEYTHFIGAANGLKQVTVPCVIGLSNSGYNYISYPLIFTLQGKKLYVSGIATSYDGGNNYQSLNVIQIQTNRWSLNGSARNN